MNVLFLAHSFPRDPSDPVGSFVLRLAVALRAAGVDVTVLAPSAPGLASRAALEGVPVERFRYGPRGAETLAYTATMRARVQGSWAARAMMGSFLAAEFLAALRLRRRFAWDVVHAHWWLPGGLVGAWLGQWRGVPLVTTLHGSDLRLAQEVRIATRLFRYVAHRSAAITAVSQWLARGVETLVPDVRAIVAPMPIKADLFRPGGPRPPARLLFVGKLNEQKGIAPALRALAQMQCHATLDIVVGVGSDEREARSVAAALGIADRLRWHPLLPQAELARLYREATALVMPALDEGLGLVAVEALLSETPVVAFASGGLTDVVVHEQTGLLVPPGDVPALAAALDRLLALPDRGAAWGRAGRQHALAAFGPEAAAQRYSDLYRTALGRPRR
ncbi:MAG TPA: glycosyltransferase [Gemmatimonadales bacterium]|nr:glycosyltransferase [Gemmatimonadales bacterium]